MALRRPRRCGTGRVDPQLPQRIRITAIVKDADGEPIPDATVTFSLSGLGWPTANFEDTTDADGRSEWRTELAAGGSQEPVRATVEVVAPNGESNGAFKEIRIS